MCLKFWHKSLDFAAFQTVIFFYIQCDVFELKGHNYKIWNERILLQLGWMDVDYAIRKDKPPVITDESSPADVTLYERWKRSNRFSVMFIKTKISVGICGSVDQQEKVWDLLKAIDDQFITSDKSFSKHPDHEVLLSSVYQYERCAWVHNANTRYFSST